MNKSDKIVILGANGLVGSAIARVLEKLQYENVIKSTRQDLELMDQVAVHHFFETEKPDFVFMAAAKVGGIMANSRYKADFIYENITIQNNILGAAHQWTPKKLLFLGSSCIYPKNCPQPIKEEYLLTSELEKTNEAYAIAKIAGLKTVEYFREQYGHPFFSVMPTNLYGPHDNFDPENSHVIPGLITRMVEAKNKNASSFSAWGSGVPRREFMYIDDMAQGCVFLMNCENKDLPSYINMGVGQDISIKELVFLIKDIVGFKGTICFDESKPDGTLKKLLDISQLKDLGWKSRTNLQDGLEKTVQFYLKSIIKEDNREKNGLTGYEGQNSKKLLNKIALLKSNRHYRLGDIIFCKGYRWEHDRNLILASSKFDGSFLKDFLIESPEPGKNVESKLHHTLKKHQFRFTTDSNALYISLRTGDIVMNKKGKIGIDELHITAKQLNIFNPMRLTDDIQAKLKKNPNINKLIIVTAMHFGDNEIHDLWRFSEEAVQENHKHLNKLFDTIYSKINLPIEIQEPDLDPIANIDKDLLTLVYAPNIILDQGGFADVVRVSRVASTCVNDLPPEQIIKIKE